MTDQLHMEFLADRVEATLQAHKAPCRVYGGTIGLTTNRLHLQPAPHVRFNHVNRLADDIALALGAPHARVFRDQYGIAIEFPNDDPKSITLTALLDNHDPLPPITAALGVTVQGKPLSACLSSPDVAHILISGTTGCGKSNLLRCVTASLITNNNPRDLCLLIIDPKGRTFPSHFSAPHLLDNQVLSNPQKALAWLQAMTALMDTRDQNGESTPHIIILIDELADFIMTRQDGIESTLIRLVQSGRQTGIHLIAATQRPSAAIVSGLMRANFSLRLVGRTTSAEDSRIAAGRGGVGAERLNGRGDFIAVNSDQAKRFQVPLVKPTELLTPHTNFHPTNWPKITLPDPHRTPVPDVTSDLDIFIARLRPWWDQNRHRWASQEWGIQTEVIKLLFPGDPAATNAGFWRETMFRVIEHLQAATTVNPTTTTDLLPTLPPENPFPTG